jgi:4-amino-4-deoxy-L-arabinose transferase-like glycosyltransferase
MPSLQISPSIKPAEKLFLCLWMVFCFLVLTYKLGEVPPYHADENFYVESSLRMVESGDYITPVYHDKKRFAKPILYYWMVASSYELFGVSLSSARLPSVIFGTLSIGLVFLLAFRLFDSRVGMFSALILPSIYLHFQISRWSTTDMALSFFILLALYFFVLSFKTEFKENAYAYLFYLSMGLGFMVKGPPAILIPCLIVLGFLIAIRKKNWFRDLRVAQGLFILAVMILPWFVAMFWMHGEEFKNHIVGNEIKNRLVHSTPFSFYYFGVLFRYQLPWSLFFLLAVIKQLGFLDYVSEKGASLFKRIKGLGRNTWEYVKQIFKEGNESVAICYIWIIVCLALFTLLRVEHSRYMLPSCPAVAILTARLFAEVEKSSWGLKIFGFKGSVFATALIFLVFSILTVVGILIYGSVPEGIFSLPIFLIVGAISLIWFARIKSVNKLVFSLGLVLVLTFGSLSGDVLPFANRYPMKSFANHITREKFSGPIAVYKLGSHRARLGVLTGRTVLKTNQKIYLVIKKSDWEQEKLNSSLEVLMTDEIAKKTRIKTIEITGLFDREKLRDILNSTEKIYLMGNV